MEPASAEPIRFTYEDYLGFPDDGRRHELIDGEHVVTPGSSIHGAPDLVVEIVSPSSRRTDEMTKRRLFDRSLP